MATIWKEVAVEAAPEQVWARVRDIGTYHQHLFPGVLTDTRVEPGARVVTFADGQMVREPIVTIDEGHRRVAWTVEGGPLEHHNASLQVLGEANGKTRILWITDVLPDSAAPTVEAIVSRGAEAMKATLDGSEGAFV